MARKTPPLPPKAPISDALAPEIETPLDFILERLERLEESTMRDRATASERLLGSESLIAALIAKIDLLERRLEDLAAIAQAEPITATLEYTTAEIPAAQLKDIEHKLHLLNNSIGAY
jgi:hypothetical protein